MPDTENCGRIPRKIPKTWSAEVVVGEFIDWYSAWGFPHTTHSEFKRYLEYFINEASDRYRLTTTKAPNDHRLLKIARQLVGEAGYTISAYFPEVAGDRNQDSIQQDLLVRLLPQHYWRGQEETSSKSKNQLWQLRLNNLEDQERCNQHWINQELGHMQHVSGARDCLSLAYVS